MTERRRTAKDARRHPLDDLPVFDREPTRLTLLVEHVTMKAWALPGGKATSSMAHAELVRRREVERRRPEINAAVAALLRQPPVPVDVRYETPSRRAAVLDLVLTGVLPPLISTQLSSLEQIGDEAWGAVRRIRGLAAPRQVPVDRWRLSLWTDGGDRRPLPVHYDPVAHPQSDPPNDVIDKVLTVLNGQGWRLVSAQPDLWIDPDDELPLSLRFVLTKSSNSA